MLVPLAVSCGDPFRNMQLCCRKLVAIPLEADSLIQLNFNGKYWVHMRLANFFEKKNTPTRSDLQMALERNNFDLRLPSDWKVKSDDEEEIFCELSGKTNKNTETSAIYSTMKEFFEDEDIMRASQKQFKKIVGRRKASLSFFLNETLEGAAISFMLSYCLVKEFDALCFDADAIADDDIEGPLSLEAMKGEIDFALEQIRLGETKDQNG